MQKYQWVWDCLLKPKYRIYALISFLIFMQKDACCTGTGLCKWACPTVSGFVAGLIMIAAGLSKFIGGKMFLTAVGGMALSVAGISGHSKVALILGAIAATIEVLGGLSFAIGCRMTSKWAALGLSAVIGIAILFKLTHLQPLTGDAFHKAAGLLEQIRLDLLLFAVFFQKALKLLRSCCGMNSACCSSMPAKK